MPPATQSSEYSLSRRPNPQAAGALNWSCPLLARYGTAIAAVADVFSLLIKRVA